MKHILLLLPLAVALCSCTENKPPQPVDPYVQAAQLFDAKQYDQALPLLTTSAQMGNANAQLMLAKCYDFGYGVTGNMAEAIKWYTSSADAGNANALDNLGTCYATGTGVKQDLDKAYQLYSKAAELNEPSALNNLGLCYLNGEGVDKDPRKAVEYFHKAALQGNADGQYNLGRCYFHGIGSVRADLAKSREWVAKAAAQGHKNAKAFMEDNDWTL